MSKREHNIPPLLPSGYRQLEYLESTGTQYIDTGISFSNNDDSMIIDLKFSYTEYQRVASILGAQHNNPNLCITPFIWLNGNRQVYVLCGGSDRLYYISSTSYTSWGTVNDFHFSMDNGTYDSYFNTITSSGSYVKNFPLGYNIYLFRSNHPDGQYCKAKVWSFSLTYNSTLVRNFTPALRVADSKPGLYDLANNQFYTNAGSGEFLYA